MKNTQFLFLEYETNKMQEYAYLILHGVIIN